MNGHIQGPRYDTSDKNLSEARQEFESLLGQHAIVSDSAECFKRSSNAWAPAHQGQKPAMVLLPRSTEHVSAIMKICSKRQIPVTSFAGGTSVSGALISTCGGVCIDWKEMDSITAVHTSDMDAVVQPGVGWRKLDARLGLEGLFFPPDPSQDACIGGMIAMSCAGTNTYRYGTMKEWVIGLTVVLADGRIVKTRQRPRKSSAGYDLTHLIIGSEGTLGLVTEATIKLACQPVNLHIVVATFSSAQAAVKACLGLINAGLLLDAIELLDRNSIKAINVSKLSGRKWEELETVFIKLSGSQSTVEDLLETIKKTAEANGCKSFEATGKKNEIEAIWDARKKDGTAALAMKKDPTDIFLINDAAVPISRVADLIEESYRLTEGTGMFPSVTAHLGDGNLHVKLICAASQKGHAEDIIHEIERLAVSMDGTVSGEHGIGLKLKDQLVGELGENAVDVMRSIKLALDPLFILNPDKIFNVEVRT